MCDISLNRGFFFFLWLTDVEPPGTDKLFIAAMIDGAGNPKSAVDHLSCQWGSVMKTSILLLPQFIPQCVQITGLKCKVSSNWFQPFVKNITRYPEISRLFTWHFTVGCISAAPLVLWIRRQHKVIAVCFDFSYLFGIFS